VLEHDDWALITHLTSPGRQPEMNRSSRMTWLDTEGTTCRVEFVADRWQLSRYSPASETMTALCSRSLPPIATPCTDAAAAD